VIFHIIREIFRASDRRQLFLRDPVATGEGLARVIRNLQKAGAIGTDEDYHKAVYRVHSVDDGSAEEICALVNPFGYISHLSAMQRWGLTDRRPEALHLTMPPANGIKPRLEEQMLADYGVPFANLPAGEAVKLPFIRHPEAVRGRKISVYETKTPGKWLRVQGAHARLATIGQTFVDMLERPNYCGGMAHVVDVWREHATTYQEEIIGAVEETATPIAKVRAGYLLDDILGVIDDSPEGEGALPGSGDDSPEASDPPRISKDPRIQGWVRFAQRGSSRVLDPAKDFSADHSEKWMLSINV
jgi:predicted transcriptional regulator of viral defense system